MQTAESFLNSTSYPVKPKSRLRSWLRVILDDAFSLVLVSLVCLVGYVTGWGHAKHSRRLPKVGDIYVSYTDNRSDSYALTNGFAPEYVHVQRITLVTNGMAYWSHASFEIHTLTNLPGSYPGGWGPVSNFKKYGLHRKRIEPD